MKLVKFLLALAFLFTVVSFAPSKASSATLNWPMTNATPYLIDLKQFSKTRTGFVWPATNRSWYIYPGQTLNYRLSCIPGEYICFGGSARPDPSITWGTGLNNSKGCTNCCVTCLPGESTASGNTLTYSGPSGNDGVGED